MTKKENNIVLLSITLCWASSYVFIKSLPADLSSFAYLTMTTGIAGVILFVVFFQKIKFITSSVLLKGFIMSLFMIGNLLAEKEGISLIPASNASFISALNILFVPLLLLLLRKYPSKNNVLGIVIILFGLSITNGFNLAGFMNKGTFFMIIACVIMAFYTISADRFTKEEDPLLIGITQIWITAIIAFILWFIENPRTFMALTYTNKMLSSIFILAFFTKAYAYIMLMYSQKYTNPVSVTLIASLEPVVTLGLALLIPSASGKTENFQLNALIGAVAIAIGAIIAGMSFMEKKKIPLKEGDQL
jgi:drug/metabolite transporter (DMT)-like permease